jgi:hypothetical protein
MRRRFEMPVIANYPVEIFGWWKNLDEELPARGTVFGLELADGEIRPERLTVIRKGYFELIRNRRIVRTGVALGREAPAQDGLRECTKVWDPGSCTFADIEGALLDTCPEESLPLKIAAVEDRARANERGR